MEKVERRDLPGNDASWYQALLNDLPATDAEPVALVEPVDNDEAAEETEEDPEPHLTLPAVSTGDPVQFPEEDLPAFPRPLDLAAAAGHDLAETTDSATEHVPGVDPDQTLNQYDGAATDATSDLPEVVDLEPAAPDPVAQPDEAIGPDDTAAPPAEAIAAPPSDDPTGPAPLMTSVPVPTEPESPAETTSETVGQLWTSSATTGPLDTWEPDAMDKTISSSRGFRWTSVFAAVAVVALIVVGLVLLPSITRGRADEHSDLMTTALTELRAELPDTQISLEVATEPNSDPTSLRGLSTQLTALSARSSAVVEVSQADLPKTPPLTSSAPIDELEPIRQRMEPIGTTAQTIQSRIANLVEYRTLMSGFLDLPALPSTADSATHTELRVVLASAQAQSASILADLPSDVSLAPHEELARSINEDFANWQIDYLEALRNEDADAAAALVAELDSDLDELDAALVTPLAQIRRQTDADLIDLARTIDEVSALANGDTRAP
ncbi:MAG: hypothetical protein GY788_19470 [bacterium]|nr:hypothetical protein [bacterium]